MYGDPRLPGISKCLLAGARGKLVEREECSGAKLAKALVRGLSLLVLLVLVKTTTTEPICTVRVNFCLCDTATECLQGPPEAISTHDRP